MLLCLGNKLYSGGTDEPHPCFFFTRSNKIRCESLLEETPMEERQAIRRMVRERGEEPGLGPSTKGQEEVAIEGFSFKV